MQQKIVFIIEKNSKIPKVPSSAELEPQNHKLNLKFNREQRYRKRSMAQAAVCSYFFIFKKLFYKILFV